MAHYAFLDENNIVIDIIVGIDETETIEGKDPETWYGEYRGQVCKRTSYNTKRGEHTEGGTPFRLNYVGIGMVYDETLDGFIPPQPFDSWTLDEQTGIWNPPVPRPDDDKVYEWDEETLQWIEILPEE